MTNTAASWDWLSGATIRYNEDPRTGFIKVKVDGVYTGTIVRNGPFLWCYQPKGLRNPPGESFSTIGGVKFSLEN